MGDSYQMQSLEIKPLLLDVRSITLRLTHEEFEKLCEDNPDRSFELTATGELIVRASAGWESSGKNSDLTTDVNLWNGQDVEVLGSPTILSGEDVLPGFTLDLGSIFSSV
jgi:Uma2 family endonuclease